MRRLTLVGLLALFGCGGGEEPKATEGTMTEQGETTTGAEAQQEQAQAMSAACPMEVQGATVQAENVEGGAALIFTTTGDVDDLRERVRHFAAMQEAEGMRGSAATGKGMMQQGQSAAAKSAEAMGDEQQGEMMGGADQGMSMGAGMEGAAEAMPQVNTRVEDIEGGARLVIIPMDSGDLDQVRTQVEQQAQTMTGGECPAMTSSTAMPEEE